MSGQSNVRKFGTVLSEASGQSRAKRRCSTPPHSSPTHSTFSKKGQQGECASTSTNAEPFRGLSAEQETMELLLLRELRETPKTPTRARRSSGCSQPLPRTFRRVVRFADQVRVHEALVVVETPLQEMPAPSTSAMEERRQRAAEDDGDSPTKRRRQGSEIQDVVVTASNQASASANTESYMEDVVVEATNLVLVNDQPVNEPLETVVPPSAFIENEDDQSGERPSRSRKPSLRQTTLKLRDRAVAGAKHTYRTTIQTRSKTRSSPYAR
ncbi:hypothetical protein BC829DRAFT_420857 [Chytridium lagenaria]|nr:hypothetical protein BC829DRAFT_420857 [Chytridium lagenaria]